MAGLFDPLELRSITLRNRIGMAPMCMYAAVDGLPQPWQLMHYGARAAGGCGLVIVEATAIHANGRITPQDCGIYTEGHVAAWRTITHFLKELGATPAIQLAHAGRKAGAHSPLTGKGPLGADGGWQPVAPSPLAYDNGWPVPHELSAHEIDQLVVDFGSAARLSRAAGFDALELHMAHGYLLHQFLSPLTNQRTDDFGGDLEKRMCFPLMVAQQVRLEWPDDLPLIVRISSTDWADGGWTIEDSVEFTSKLQAIGVDMIDVSSGGAVPDAQHTAVSSDADPGFQVPLAARIRHDAEINTAAVGLITEPQQAEEILADGHADLVLLGRELLRDPHWPLRAAYALKQPPPWPERYNRARKGLL